MRRHLSPAKPLFARLCVIVTLLAFCLTPNSLFAQRQLEKLDRGVVAMYISSGQTRVSWRIFGNDNANVGFNLYKKVDGGDAVKINSTVITGRSNYLATGIDPTKSNVFFVKPVVDEVEGEASKSFELEVTTPYIPVDIDIPPGGTTPDNVDYTYSANDCSVGDLDGDGDYEIIVKWDPSNSKDNSQSGYTGNVILDAYTLEGEKLWRIDLGKNIRAGAHYTQFMVYDLDGDGKAELACKTGDGTTDAAGTVIGDATADHRNSNGYILEGPEYLTVFNGLTGEIITSTQYYPQRYPGTDNPTSAQMDEMWGDSYGNRIDRFLACVAYLDGLRPSLVMCRGYYTRTAIAAYDFKDGELSTRWIFDTEDTGKEQYESQGNHQLSVNDVDQDGKDEIVYGSMVIDNNGDVLYSTGRGHGDAMHVSDFVPSLDGQEMFCVHEEYPNEAGVEMRRVGTGEDMWIIPGYGDIGRGVAFDVDPNYAGAECWASEGTGMHSCETGEVLTTTYPTTAGGGASYNMAAWWDDDLLRELVDRTVITKWNWNAKSTDRLYTVYEEGISANNGSKSSPCLIADILGDWREEIIFRKSDNTQLYIFVTTDGTTHGLFTLMHDCQYRTSIAWQNVGYNQPAHTSFFLGYGMETPASPIALYVDAENPYNPDETIPVIDEIDNQVFALGDDCSGVLPDFSSLVNVTDEKVADILYYQTPAAGTVITADDPEVTVTMYINDGYGNVSNSVEFTATAQDQTGPVFTYAFPDHPIRTSGNCQGVLPDYTQYIQYEDNCSSEITATMNPAAGTVLTGDGDYVKVTVTLTDESGNSTDSSWVATLSAPDCFGASVDESSVDLSLSVFPNPASDFAFIDVASDVTIESAAVVTTTGETVMVLSSAEIAKGFAVNKLAEGVYFVKLATSNGTVSLKFVKE